MSTQSPLFFRHPHRQAVLKNFLPKRLLWKKRVSFLGIILIWSDLLSTLFVGIWNVMKSPFLLHTSLLLLFFFSINNASSTSEMAPNHLHVESNEYLFATPSNRKMKLQDSEQSNPTRKNVHVGDVNLYDYHPIDPVPSSKRSIKHGPIEHGSPLIPHMPNPSPPDQPQPGGFV